MATRKSLRMGPGLLVTAAFVGPGTVITASKAGAEQGCQLLWAILFATVGAIVLQSLAARLGIIHQMGLGEALRKTFTGSKWLKPAIVLVISAIGIGNAAYQTGNLTGAAAGVGTIAGGGTNLWVIVLAIFASGLLALGRYRILQNVLIGLVVFLSLAFLSTASLSLPNLPRIASGFVMPQVSEANLTLVVALIGTTIVPYNLFLHASSAAKTWQDVDRSQALRQAWRDTVLSISLGGLVTTSIVLTASSAFFDAGRPMGDTGEIARQLRPTLGSFSEIAFAFGLFAAGMTSAITAPMATAYALCGCLGWKAEPSSAAFRAIALAVVAAGTLAAILFGGSPTETIVFAQVANGLLLPIVAVFLVTIVYRTAGPALGFQALISLVFAWLVVFLVSLLAVWRLYYALFA